MNFPSGKSGFHYSVNFCRRDGRPAFRFELYVDGKDENDVDRRFTQLMERRAAIERMRSKMRLTGNGLMGEGHLAWRATSRRRSPFTPGRDGAMSAPGRSRMGPFREVVQPHIDTFG